MSEQWQNELSILDDLDTLSTIHCDEPIYETELNPLCDERPPLLHISDDDYSDLRYNEDDMEGLKKGPNLDAIAEALRYTDISYNDDDVKPFLHAKHENKVNTNENSNTINFVENFPSLENTSKKVILNPEVPEFLPRTMQNTILSTEKCKSNLSPKNKKVRNVAIANLMRLHALNAEKDVTEALKVKIVSESQETTEIQNKMLVTTRIESPLLNSIQSGLNESTSNIQQEIVKSDITAPVMSWGKKCTPARNSNHVKQNSEPEDIETKGYKKSSKFELIHAKLKAERDRAALSTLKKNKIDEFLEKLYELDLAKKRK